MPFFRFTTRGRGVAFAAALALVVQALLASFAIGTAMASGPTVDAFGNPLCIADTVSGEHDGAQHSALPDCCTLGCSLFGAATVDGGAPHALNNPQTPFSTALATPSGFTSHRIDAARAPGSPRSPPLQS